MTWLTVALFTTFVVFWIILAVVAAMILRDVWRRTWIPDEHVVRTVTPSERPAALHPEPELPEAARPRPSSTVAAWIVLGVVALAAAIGFAYGSETVQASILMGGSLTLLVGWFAFVVRG